MTKEELKDLMEKIKTGDEKQVDAAKTVLIDELSGFIGLMIDRYTPTYKEKHYLDLYQEGVMAVLENVERFDPEAGSLTTYFTYPIKHQLLRYVAGFTNKSSPYYSANMEKVRKAKDHIAKENGGQKEPSVSAVSMLTGLSEKVVNETEKRIRHTSEVFFENTSDFESNGGYTNENPEKILERRELNSCLQEALEHLDPVIADIIKMFFGIDRQERMSYSEISKLTGFPVNNIKTYIKTGLLEIGANESLARLCNGDSYEERKIRHSSNGISLETEENLPPEIFFQKTDEDDDTYKFLSY